jgi:predicted Zn-dependent protease
MKNLLLGLLSIVIFSFWSCDGGVSKYHSGAQFIGLQPYEDIDIAYLNIAKEAIEDYYGYDVKILEPIKLPKIARKKVGSRYKYNADKLLIHLQQALPDDVTKIVGIVDHNIYTDQGVIVSKSKRPGPVTIVSISQVKKLTRNTELFKNRLKKIVLKQVGHSIGLSNCENKDSNSDCLMNSGASRSGLDRVGYHFCEECAKKLNWDDKAQNK